MHTTSNESEQSKPRFTRQVFEALKAFTFDQLPIFQKIVGRYGAKTVFDYAGHFLKIKFHPGLYDRRQACLNIIQTEVSKRFGAKAGVGVRAQLEQKPVINTTDHHAIITHPFWVNTEIITSFQYVGQPDIADKYLVVLSFASVSQNNASGFPRGIMFHGGDRGEGELVRLPLLPDKTKMHTVYGTPAYTREDIERAIALLQNKQREGHFTEKRTKEVENIMRELLLTDDILAAPDFASQISRINAALWPRFFRGEAALPQLIYLDVETVVRELLLQEILNDPQSMPYRMLFDAPVRDLVQTHFHGIAGAHTVTETKQYGTLFFWGRDAKGYRVGLKVAGDRLVSANPSVEFSIELTPEAIAEGLRTNKIFPSTMLVYSTIALYYGFKCLGGFSQVNDLTQMKDAYTAILRAIGVDAQELAEVGAVQTKEFSGDGIVLAYHEDLRGNLVAATGIDLLLQSHQWSYADYIALAKEIMFEESLAPLVPEMYTVIIPQPAREANFAAFTEQAALEVSGFKARLLELFQKLHLS